MIRILNERMQFSSAAWILFRLQMINRKPDSFGVGSGAGVCMRVLGGVVGNRKNSQRAGALGLVGCVY